MSEEIETVEEEIEQPIEQDDSLDSIESEDDLVDAIKERVKSLEQPVEEVEQTQEEEPEQPVTTEEESDSNEEEVSPEVDEAQPQTFKLKNKGTEIEVNLEELVRLGHAGLSLTEKTQALAEFRKTQEYMQEHKISMDDLHRLADLKSGKHEVLSQYAKELGIDLYDAQDKEYTPSPDNAYRQATSQDVYMSELQQDTELVNKIQSIASSMPESFRNEIGTNFELFQGYVDDVRSGWAERIKPVADKISALNPSMTYLQAYVQAANSLAQQQEVVEQPTVEHKAPPVVETPVVDKSKLGKPKQGSSNSANDLDVWNDALSEDELVERIKQASMKNR